MLLPMQKDVAHSFEEKTDKAVGSLLEFIESGKLKVRRYEKSFLHSKAFLFATENEGVIAGSSNFTAAGLTRNLELNLGRYDPTPVGMVRQWYEQLWEDAVPYDLAKVYAERYEPHLTEPTASVKRARSLPTADRPRHS